MSIKDKVAQAAELLAREGLCIGTSGNVSVRQDDLVAITATGVVLAECTAADVTVVDLDGSVVEGTLKPSAELSLHLALYTHTDCGAVVHTHAPFSTAAACALTELPVLHYQNLTLGGAVRVADYATFGTQELANNVLRALDGRHAALLANHGAVAIGATLPKAADNALLLEWLAALYHRALQFGQPRELTDEQIQDVITQAIRLNYGSRQVRR